MDDVDEWSSDFQEIYAKLGAKHIYRQELRLLHLEKKNLVDQKNSELDLGRAEIQIKSSSESTTQLAKIVVAKIMVQLLLHHLHLFVSKAFPFTLSTSSSSWGWWSFVVV